MSHYNYNYTYKRSHSWLSYGVDGVREQIWSYMINNISNNNHNHSEDNNLNDNKIIINNPCTALGNEEIMSGNIIMSGTGNPYECVALIKQVLWPHGPCAEGTTGCPLDGIVHPSIEKLEFFGMSVYFYALDCIRHMGTVPLLSW